MRQLPACVAVAGVARPQTKNNRDSHESAAVRPPARRWPAIAALIFLAAMLPRTAPAQEKPGIEEFGALNEIEPGAPAGSVNFANNVVTATNGFYVRYGDTLLMADSGVYNRADRRGGGRRPRAH